jgi:hypothetical protein
MRLLGIFFIMLGAFTLSAQSVSKFTGLKGDSIIVFADTLELKKGEVTNISLEMYKQLT